MTDVVTSTLQVDLKRRTTLPADILAAAGIPPGSTLVARVEESGRIVLESPQLLLTLLQEDIAAAMTAELPAAAADPKAGEVALVEQPGVEESANTPLEQLGAPAAGTKGRGQREVPTLAGALNREGRA